MRVKTSELTGAALDWAVANCEAKRAGATIKTSAFVKSLEIEQFAYSTNWLLGGPIIEREKLCPIWSEKLQEWGCTKKVGEKFHFAKGPTFMIAAMRCYVASKLGDEVDVPEELL